ncbi:DUF7298 domain-containing protein [Streptomyces werraensis]|uniref:DUF7298 domain-containing protein n=1 Tax=Streptomyces werraensis TaxID=68284 RepID=UPI00381CB6EA
MGLLSADHMPRGVVAIMKDLGTTAYVGDTETVVYQLGFTAAPKRIYRVHLQAYVVDVDGVGDNTNSNIRYAKNSALVRCRWASGSTVTASSTVIGATRVTVFDDDSSTSSGVDASYYLVNPPRGLVTVGISLLAGRTAATYGSVRFLSSASDSLVIEDVGPYSE